MAMLRLNKLGFVFQTFNLLSSLTAMENVEIPMLLQGRRSRRERRDRAQMLLERFGMGKRANHLPSMLSGGEQQRVTIARALANEPELLLLDEPTGDLDTANSRIVLNLLAELNQEDGVTMVMVTHDPNIKLLAHRVVYVVDGKISRVDTTDPADRASFVEQLRQEVEDMNSESGPRSHTQTEVRTRESYAHLVARSPGPHGVPVMVAPQEQYSHLMREFMDRQQQQASS